MSRLLKLPVLKVRQPIGDFFIASMSAKDLVDISYSDVRRLAESQRDLEKYLGIQRPVSMKRIRDIKKYVAGDDATFPTAVIVAIDERCISYEEVNDAYGVLTISAFTPEDDSFGEEEIPFNRIAKVIDGQHRIAAFMDENDNWAFEFEDRPFDINVSIFIGADVSDQASVFATVNLAQTKVNKSLVYDLTELSRTRSPYKTCHNVAVALDREPRSPFYKRIKRLGAATPGRSKEPITQAAFVESLVRFISDDPIKDRNDLLAGRKIPRSFGPELGRLPFRNLFVEGKELDIAEIIFNYFCAVREKWPESWNEVGTVGNLLPRSNAFKALMKYLKEDVYLDLVGEEFGRIPSVEEFAFYFRHLNIKDRDFITRNFAPGSGGQSAFLKVLRGELTLEELTKRNL